MPIIHERTHLATKTHLARIIAGQRTYQWGEPIWDCICVHCGAVWPSTTPAEEICPTCNPLQSLGEGWGGADR